MKAILYVHGMGGGGDSRIPAILRERLPEYGDEGADLSVTVRTYDFNPAVAAPQIAAWAEELKPCLVIGESLGSIHAIAISGVPHILVSPSLNAPLYFSRLAPLTRLPGVTAMMDRHYRPRPGDRQTLHFSHENIRDWPAYRERALANSPARGGKDPFFAFFGSRDHYRLSGVVLLRTWKKYFGDDSYRVYPGSHFMEEEFILSMLIPKILETVRG